MGGSAVVFPHWASVVMITASVIGALAVIYAKAIKPIIRTGRKVHAVFDQVMKYDDRLDRIEHQFENNSGSSMRDAIDRIEEAQVKVTDRLDEHISWGQGEVLKVWQTLAAKDAVEAAKHAAETLTAERGSE